MSAAYRLAHGLTVTLALNAIQQSRQQRQELRNALRVATAAEPDHDQEQVVRTVAFQIAAELRAAGEHADEDALRAWLVAQLADDDNLCPECGQELGDDDDDDDDIV